jgi:EAL domain-containing protein (putative c-di-GMP-specific phosphodiesterase class I)
VALEQRELALHYQPQFDASTGELVGAEALARWNVDGNWVPPDVFIRLAEDTGLVETLGEQLLQVGLLQLAQWEPKLPVGFRLALNLSAREFQNPGLDTRWIQAAQQADVRPDRLSLEVTETVLLSNDAQALDVLQKLRAAGVEIALDDFGTGYASLSYLRVLDLDVLKIDKSFISSVGQDVQSSAQHRDRAVVQATLSMAHALGCCVVAEGVETDAQADWLRLQGCDVLQGYGLGKPVNASEFEAMYLMNTGGRGQKNH